MSDPITLEEAIKTARNLDAWRSSVTNNPEINQTNRTRNSNTKRNIKHAQINEKLVTNLKIVIS